MLIIPSYLSSPQRNIRAIVNAASQNPSSKTHQTFASYYHLFSRGYVLVLYTGNQSEFSSEYVIVSKIDNKIIVDLIHGAGSENVSQLLGDDAISFLKEHQISLDALKPLNADKNE